MNKPQQLAELAKEMPWPIAVIGEMVANKDDADRKSHSHKCEAKPVALHGADWGWTNRSRFYFLKLLSGDTIQRGNLAGFDDPQQWQLPPHTWMKNYKRTCGS